MAIRGPYITTAQWLGRTLLICSRVTDDGDRRRRRLGGVQPAGLWPAVIHRLRGYPQRVVVARACPADATLLVFSFGFFTFLLNGLIF